MRSPQTTTAWLDDISRTLTKSVSSSKNGCDAIQGDGGLQMLMMIVTAHAVCRREVCSGPCSLSFIFLPSLVSQQIWCVSLSVRRWHAAVRCLIEKGRHWCSHQPTKLSVWRSHVVQSKRTHYQPGKIRSGALVIYTACYRATSSPLTDVNVAGSIVPLTDTVKLLGVTIDHHLTFDSHVQNVCKSAYYHIWAEAHSLIPFHQHDENGCMCVGEFATR